MTSSEADPPHGSSRSPDSPGQPSDVPLRETLRPSGPPRVALRVEHRPDKVIAYLEGELDILTAPKLGARIDGVIRASTGDFILDLQDLEFIDSAGLQLLLNTRRRLLRTSRNLSVVCDEGAVMRVIELTRLTETLGVINP